MNDFLKKLHNKPEHKRRTFALGVSATFTAFIFVVWFSIYTTGFNTDLAEVKKSVVSPLAAIKVNTANVFSGFERGLGGLKDKVDEINSEIKDEYKTQVVQTYTASSSETSQTASF